MTAVLADSVALARLAALLATATLHLLWRREAAVAVTATVVVLATGLVSMEAFVDTVRVLLPVVLFLVTILVVSDVCARAGLFAAAARAVGSASRGRPARLLLGVFLLAALVTVVLSLDATVVLLTPIVVAAVLATLGTSDRPTSFACLRMANSASILFPVSNLTNLLALPHLDLDFIGFAARMAPVLLVVLVVEYAGLRLLFRREVAAPNTPVGDVTGPAVPVVPVVVVSLMLVGFAVLSRWDLAPAWVSGAAAVVLAGWAIARGLVRPRDVARAAHPSFALLVLALGVVVAAVASGFLGDLVAQMLPDRATSYVALFGLAVLATVAAALLTNLSATILLVPLIAPLGTTAVLAALLGLNIGSGLTWTGSLANLLWRRTLAQVARPVGGREFYRVSLAITPVSLAASVAVLWALS